MYDLTEHIPESQWNWLQSVHELRPWQWKRLRSIDRTKLQLMHSEWSRRKSWRQPRTPPEKIREVQRAIESGEPLDNIRSRLGVSIDTVLAVKRGRFRPDGTRLPTELDVGQSYLAEPTKCHECGNVVFIVPCRICAARAYQRKDLSDGNAED